LRVKRLTLTQQGRLHYALSPFNEPKLIVKPGETLIVETEDAFSINWPRIESIDYLMAAATFGNGRPLEEAVRIAFMELIFWLEKECGFD